MSGAVTAEAGSIEAVIPYVVPGETARFYPTRREKSYWPVEEHRVRVRDARPEADRFDLEKTGFVLLQRPTAVKDFTDPGEVRRVYYPEIEALVKSLNGADRVLVFGEIVRTDAPGARDGVLPARGAHVDYDEQTTRQFVKDMLPADEAEAALKGRLVEMNLWRPVRTVERMPLAVCDASTVSRRDLNPSLIFGGLDDPDRQTMAGYNLHYDPRHRWYYVPRMRPDEILVFKLCDTDADRVQLTGHTAFEDPTSAPDAAPRQSIEIRTVSIFYPRP
jgi:hypothetical protein